MLKIAISIPQGGTGGGCARAAVALELCESQLFTWDMGDCRSIELLELEGT